jgi:hypothetical protein
MRGLRVSREENLSDLIEKEFQYKTLMQSSLLHECVTITNKDHAVQLASLPESFKLKLFSYKIDRRVYT